MRCPHERTRLALHHVERVGFQLVNPSPPTTFLSPFYPSFSPFQPPFQGSLEPGRSPFREGNSLKHPRERWDRHAKETDVCDGSSATSRTHTKTSRTHLEQRSVKRKEKEGAVMAPSVFISARDGDLKHVKRALDEGGNVDGREPKTEATCLHFAAKGNHPDIVTLLIKRAANVNLANKEGATPLHEAAAQGCQDCVQLLLEGGSRLEAKDKTRQNAIHLAAFYGRDQCLAAMLDFQTKKEMEERTVQASSTKGEPDPLVDHKDILGMTPLYYAAKNGHDACVRILLDAKADPLIKNNTGSTSLHAAASGNCFAVVERLFHACGPDPFLQLKDRKARVPSHICKDKRLACLLEGRAYESEIAEEAAPGKVEDPPCMEKAAEPLPKTESPPPRMEGTERHQAQIDDGTELFSSWKPFTVDELVESLHVE